jgi:NADH-quinone oxidoreductase subunit C/D
MTSDLVAVPDPARLGEATVINLGPSHPATHGTLRIKAWVDGEVVLKARVEIGYLHRCFEKESESHTYTGVIPYTDRLNYCSSFLNNVGYCLAVEKLFDIEAPPRAQAIRVILGEFSRIMDHLVCLGANLVDLGALTNFWYFFRPREEILGLIEACSGGRLMATYCRVGGLVKDVPPDFEQRCRGLLALLPPYLDDVDGLVATNRIFIDRTRGVGRVSAEDAIAWGFTGPCLRASGVSYDARKAHPYSGYDRYQFEVPVGENGDCYDRYVVRMKEMRQSIRIIEQALAALPAGRFLIDDKRVALPDKELVYTNIESLMNHFKLIMEGMKPPVGEVYSYTEAANGELGFYLVSDGTGHPYRIKVRPPCFAIYQAFEEMLVGSRISDAVAILGTLNVIAGELDR